MLGMRLLSKKPPGLEPITCQITPPLDQVVVWQAMGSKKNGLGAFGPKDSHLTANKDNMEGIFNFS